MSKRESYLGGSSLITPRNYEAVLERKAIGARRWAMKAQLEFDKERQEDEERRLAAIAAFNRDPRKRSRCTGGRRRRR